MKMRTTWDKIKDWFWLHFTREGRDLLDFIACGGNLSDVDEI
jgi:hypothetical protein